MRKTFVFVFGAIALSGAILLGGKSALASLCNNAIGNQTLCLQMKALGSQVELLDAQRDTMQLNFPFLTAITSDMAQLIDEILKSAPASHDQALKTVKATVTAAQLEAQQRDANVLLTVNTIRNECMSCHTNTNPQSGIKWDEISRYSWEKVIPLCNEVGKNPYLCKSMHSMFSNIGYVMKSFQAQNTHFEALAEVAADTQRIAADLLSKNISHGDPTFLSDVKVQAAELEALARAHDKAAHYKSLALGQACAGCHALK